MRFALLLFCATLSAQKPTPVPIPIGVTAPGRGVNFYSIEKEQALGAQLAAEYRRQIRAFDAPSVNAYLDELGQRLAAQAPATGFTFTFELVDDDQTWIHEAAAFPGGPVFVPASLILAVSSEDELAAMLAHAIAHIATRQETRQMTRVQIVNQSAIPLINMGGWNGYAIRQGASLAVPIGFLAFQRKHELESDQLAVRFLSSAGYDPQALARLLGGGQTQLVATLVASAASHFKLSGVVASQGKNGYALISIDGKPARPYRVGARLNDALLLHSVAPRSAALAASLDAPVSVTLDLPKLGTP